MTDAKKDWGAVRQEAEDDTVEQTAAAEDVGILNHPSYIELAEKLTLAEQQAHEHWEKLTRAKADMENERRRAQRDIEQAHRYGVERLIKEILPVLDSMEQAHQAALAIDNESMIQGIELTQKLLLDALQKVDVQAMNALNQAFNPNYHEAMTMLESTEHAPNTVVQVFQQGYLLGDRVLRPARVVVSKAKA